MRWASLFLLASLFLSGCRREEITVYRVPKEKEPELDEAQGSETPLPQIQWKTPPGWAEQTPSGMSIAGFLIPGEAGRKAQLSVMTFPGEAAGELSLVNIVRENAGLPPVSDKELAKLVEIVNVGQAVAKLVDLTGAANSSSDTPTNRILVAVFPRSGTTWFFKLAGDATVVSSQKPAFLDFLKSVSFVETAQTARPPRFMSTNVKRVPTGRATGAQGPDTPLPQPSWEVPSGWEEAPASSLLLAKFVIEGSEGKAEVTVSVFPDDAGGVLANVNRWRGQVDLAPVKQAELEKQIASLDVLGGKAMLVDVSGQNPKTRQQIRLLGVMVPREGQTWVYKLMGDPPVAEREKAAFIRFVQSARYPNA